MDIPGSFKLTAISKVVVVEPHSVPKIGQKVDVDKISGVVKAVKWFRLIDIPSAYLALHVLPQCKTPMGLQDYLESLNFFVSRDQIMCVVFFE